MEIPARSQSEPSPAVPGSGSDPRAPVSPPRNPFFPVVVVLGGAFVVTILAFGASIVGDPAAPVNRLLERYGNHLIVGEVAGILVVGWLALVVDRRQNRQRSALPTELPKTTNRSDVGTKPRGSPG